MNTKPIVIGIGEFLWDVLPTGRKAGGAPVNFAYHASQHGAEGWGISAVGYDDAGRELLNVTAERGIHTLVSTVGYPTGTVDVQLNDGQPVYTIHENVAWDFIPLTDGMLALARRAAAICFGTLAQRNAVSRQTTSALVAAVPDDAYRIYDINLRQNYYSKELIEQSLNMADILKINDEELLKLQKMFALSADIDNACNSLMKLYGLDMIVLTGGSRFSAIYYGHGKKSELPTPKVDVVDTVGAGDAFTGCFIGSLLTGKSVEEAHRSAVDTAAYVCTTAGAWPPPQV